MHGIEIEIHKINSLSSVEKGLCTKLKPAQRLHDLPSPPSWGTEHASICFLVLRLGAVRGGGEGDKTQALSLRKTQGYSRNLFPK